MAKHIPRIYSTDINEVPESHKQHLIAVMRLQKGDAVLIFNERDGEWQAIVDFIGKKDVVIKSTRQIRQPLQNTRKVCLAFGIIKNEALKWMIQKTTELGVTDLVPVLTDYVHCRDLNYGKLKRIMISSSEQSGRLDIPKLHAITSFTEFMENTTDGTKWHAAIERTFNNTCVINTDENCGFIVGPEGGFSSNEKEILVKHMDPISLSSNILRTETAGVVCLSLLLAKHS